MRVIWSFVRVLLTTAFGVAVVWAMSNPAPDWASRPLAEPPAIDLTAALESLGLPGELPAERWATFDAPGAARVAVAAARTEAPPRDGRTAPPFAGLAVPEAAVALAREAGPLRLEPVQDADGAWVIGYGRRLPERPAAVTEAEAEAMLREDLELAAAAVREAVSTPLNENELGALAVFARSIGPENFAGALVTTLLDAGDREAAADAFLLWAQTRVDGELVESAALEAQHERLRALFLAEPGEAPGGA